MQDNNVGENPRAVAAWLDMLGDKGLGNYRDLLETASRHPLMGAYLTSLRKSTKPLLDEEKKDGVIMDYKVFLKETKSNPDDWDIAIATQFKNHAALDGLAAKGEMYRDKIMGGKQQAQEVGDKRNEIRDLLSSDLMQEVTLK